MGDRMKRSTDRILTTHVGSLVRTPEIIDVMQRVENGESYDARKFAQDLKSGVKEVVRHQADVGIDIPSDGEYGKRGWIQYVTERLGGLELFSLEPEEFLAASASVVYQDRERYPGFWRVYDRYEAVMWLPGAEETLPEPTLFRLWKAVEPVSYVGHDALKQDLDNFRSAMEGLLFQEAFMPVVAPCSVEYFNPDGYYETTEDLLFALADALSVEYRAIVDAGFVLQIDDAILPMRYNPSASVEDYLKWAEVRIEALNHALEGIPEDRVRYHMCWGSQNAPHTWDLPLEKIAPLLLSINAQAFSLEAANPRHEHEFLVWKDVKLPEGKILIPGVVSHCTNVVEHPELVALRISNFARLVGRENVIAGTDCGFSQFWNLIRVHPEVQWAKLEALVEGARIASGQLWGRAAA
jgi:5-methyltetrahydropteroyltriglutamate--homocysteine methyltransferase